MFAVPPSLRVVSLAAGALLVLSSAPALADCQTDIQGYMKRRDGIIAQLKGMQKGGKKQLDPAAACPKFRSLASVMGETVAYFEKNKEWCQIPDTFIDGAKQQRAGTGHHPPRRYRTAADGIGRNFTDLLRADPRVRSPHRRPDAAKHVFQRTRAHRLHTAGCAALLRKDAHGCAGSGALFRRARALIST
jgi:hypothetical protein